MLLRSLEEKNSITFLRVFRAVVKTKQNDTQTGNRSICVS